MIKKYLNLSIPLKSAIWFISCNVLIKGIAFFTAPLFTRLLSAEEYGKLTLFASYEQMIVIFATWEIGLSPFQRGLFRFAEDKNIFRSTVILFGMAMSALVGLILLACSNFVTRFTEMPSWIIASIVVYTFTFTAYISWMTESKLNYSYKKVSAMTVGLSVSQVIFSLAAVCFIRATASVKFFFSLFPAIVVNSVILCNRFHLSSIIRNKAKVREQLRFLITFTWPLVIHSLSYLVLGQADRVMIGKMVGNATAGLYSVSYTIASVIIIVQSAVLQVISPWIYQNMHRKAYDEIRTRMDTILLIVSALYIVFIAVAPDLIILMYPAYYWEGIWCIPPIAIGVYFMFMYSLFVAIEECLDVTKYIAVVSIICAMLNIILNYFGIKLYGYIACAYTTLFCYILFAVGHYYFMTKVVKQKIGSIKLFYGKRICLEALTIVILMVGITAVYDLRIVRYMIVLAVVTIGIIFRNRIAATIRKIKSNN